jgi:hypothetical protein
VLEELNKALEIILEIQDHLQYSHQLLQQVEEVEEVIDLRVLLEDQAEEVVDQDQEVDL